MSVRPDVYSVHRLPDAMHGAVLMCAGVPSGGGEALAEAVSVLRTAASHVLVRLPADVKAEGRALKDYAHALVAPSAAVRGRAGEEGAAACRAVERLGWIMCIHRVGVRQVMSHRWLGWGMGMSLGGKWARRLFVAMASPVRVVWPGCVCRE